MKTKTTHVPRELLRSYHIEVVGCLTEVTIICKQKSLLINSGRETTQNAGLTSQALFCFAAGEDGNDLNADALCRETYASY